MNETTEGWDKHKIMKLRHIVNRDAFSCCRQPKEYSFTVNFVLSRRSTLLTAVKV